MVDEKPSRRLALLYMTPELLVELFKDGRRQMFEVVDGLPEDATIRGAGKAANWFYSPEHAAIGLVIHSETFAEVEEGSVLPELTKPTIRNLTVQFVAQ